MIRNIRPDFGDTHATFDSPAEMAAALNALGWLPDDGLKAGRDYVAAIDEPCPDTLRTGTALAMMRGMTNTDLTVSELEQLHVDIRAALATRAGQGLVIEGRDVDLPRPTGGALLHEEWATSEHSQVTWYASTDAAMAALTALAIEHGRSVDGNQVDLTCDGCLPSSAWVQLLAPDTCPDTLRTGFEIIPSGPHSQWPTPRIEVCGSREGDFVRAVTEEIERDITPGDLDLDDADSVRACVALDLPGLDLDLDLDWSNAPVFDRR